MNIKIKIIYVLMAMSFMAKAQQGINTSSGNGTGLGGSISFSIGQIDYSVTVNTFGTVSQGLQQPFEIFTLTGIKETFINLTTHIFPNPTSEFITLKIDNDKPFTFCYEVYDIQGKQLSKNTTKEKETIIPFTNLGNGTYFLKITNDNNLIKSFKIIKNQ